ncbi:MAG: MmcQ/YjbR family DNA-binding protein [Geminicoccaceae bacterium]
MRKIAARLDLPELVEGVWYGTPSLKVRRKSPLRMKDADTLVILCPLEDKAMLMEAAPDIYFETDHYKGWPAVLVRLPAISNEELRHRLERAWRAHAP